MKFSKIIFSLLCLLFLFAITAGASESDDAKSDKAKNNFNSGVEHMHKAKQILIVGDSAFAYNYRATSDAKAKKEYEKAVKEFNATIELDPTMKEAFNNLGYCYRKLDKLDESLKAYKTALKLDPYFAQALEYLGETYLALDKLNVAKMNLMRLTQLESAYADTLAQAIEIYKLNQINNKLQEKKN